VCKVRKPRTYKALLTLNDQLTAEPNPLAFLLGGGEMGNLIRSMDWSATPLGPVEGWTQSLRTTVSICLASDLPICVIWGPDLVQLYNDAYRVICGNKHPRSMGQNFSECWKEAWPVIGEAHDSALAGDTAFLEGQQVFLERHGYVEECFFTFSFSPIRDEAGRVGGLFHPVIEMTTQMLGERRTRALRDLTAHTHKAKSVSEALCLSAQALAEYALDVPFVLLYELDPDNDQTRLVGATDLQVDPVVRLNTAGSGVKEQTSWPLEEVERSRSAVQVNDMRQRTSQALPGPYPEPPNVALALPIILPGADRPAAILIAGVSSRLRLNEPYRSFYDLLAAAVTTAVAHARAYDDERRRAKALAELDRAKIAFFSNVSHEFRTPLTLMLGPVEDALAAPDEQLPPLQRERLEVVYRNGLRLQRLVNSLLDFSKIEAGRVHAVYEPTALADFTADLASNFRSACEKAGLELRVDCPPLSEPVFVDNPIWEKIVLNLLSNAFKFTFEGEIAVSMRQVDRAVELCVRDTGTGVPAEEIPRLFERFHRVENARRRTHEGSGIGLALVQELVNLHGGSISAASEVGRGTTFTISIPMGSRHLPQDQVGNRPAAPQPTAGTNPFVEEALRWLPVPEQRSAPGPEMPSIQDDPTDTATSSGGRDDERPLVLVADDNADMRQYVVRLLGPHYRTEAVQDGSAALVAARERTPDLILTDVMMPRLDGFGLLQALRADPRMSGVPVILLSARAGEESRIEGLQEGASDYLVKPFSARELLARVAAQLQMARIRRESSAAIEVSEERFRALVSASSDVVYRMNADWTELRHLQGREFIADTHEPNRSWLDKYIPLEDQPRILEVIQASIRCKGVFELEHRVLRVDGELGWAQSRAVPMLAENGGIVEWFGTASDVTETRRAQQTLIESEERYRSLFNAIDEGYCILEMIFDNTGKAVDYRFLEVNPAFSELTGLENAVGRRICDIMPDLEEHWFTTYGKVALTGEAVRFVNDAKSMDGRWFDVYAMKVGGPDSRRVAVLFTNITERRRTEEALLAREVDLIDALAAAEDANQAKSDFLSHMSHELRSPLNAVLGFAQLLQSGTPPPTPRQEESVAEILQAGWYLLGLIDEILDLSLIESGRLSCVLEPVPLAEVLHDCQALVEGQAAAHGIRLSVARPGDACIVSVDRTRLKQVFVNLLSNAIKYNREGGSVQVHCEAVGQGRICISIEDSGSGLSPEQLTHIFQPFERLGREAGVIEGTGIGLALSKRLVELMGGRIGVHSVAGQGSVFWVELDTPGAQTSAPASPARTTSVRLQVAAVPGSAPVSRRPCTVLCVEDNRANQLLVQRLLAQRADVRLLLAGDAEHGLQLARTVQPDVVLMDINLPGMSGLQAMEHLAADAATAHIPVIAISALAMQHDIDKGIQAGFFRYLSKPIKIDAFTEALDAALDLADRPEEASAKAVVAQSAPAATSATNSENSENPTKAHTP
jgi:PAS domain S-box-containing protein